MSAAIVFPVRYVSEGLAVQTTSRELSQGGVSVRSLKPPPPGSRVSMALYLPNARIPEVAIAKVSATKEQEGFWADFVVLDPAARLRIGNILASSAGGPVNTAEHRAFQRHRVELRVRFRTARDFVVEHASNLSRGGVFILCDTPPPVNESVDVHLELPDGEVVSSKGVVVHRAPPGGNAPAGVGVQFVDAADRFRERIDRYMETLAG